MALSTKKFLQAIGLGGGTNLGELTDTTPSTNIDALVGMAAGYPEPLFSSIRAIRPDVRFSTVQLTDFFTAINAGTPPFCADQSAGNTDLWYQDSANKASRTSSASLLHQRFRMAKAFLLWTRINARHREDATVDARLKPVWDGSNVPIVAAGTLALTITPVATQRYTMGQVEINGVTLAGVQEWTLDSGLKIDEEGSEGEVYDSFAGIESTGPVFEITGRTIEWWNTYGLGTALTNITAFLIAKGPVGNVAAGTTSHIKVVGTSGLIAPVQTQGIKSSTKLRVYVQAPDATHNSLTITTGVAIT